jgi:hypothetical protein
MGYISARAAAGPITHEADGCRALHVKTLGPTHPDRGYAKTRAFYRSVGFLPLEETNGLWPDNPCLIMVKWLSLACG